PDYEFLTPEIDQYFRSLTGMLRLTGWIHGNPGLSPQLKFAWNEVGIMERLFPPLPDMEQYQARLREITAASNEMLFRVVEARSYEITDTRPHDWSSARLKPECARFLEEFHMERHAFVLRNQTALLKVLHDDAPQPAAMA